MKNLVPVSAFTTPVRAPEPLVDLRKAITVEEGLQALTDRTEFLKDTKTTGPASAVDNRLVRFDGTTGKLVQSGLVGADDLGNVSGVLGLAMTGPLAGASSIIIAEPGDIIIGTGAGFATGKWLGPAAFVPCFHSGGTTPNVGIGVIGEITLESNSNAAVCFDLNEHVPDGALVTGIHVIVNPGDPRSSTNRMKMERHSRTLALGSPPTIGTNTVTTTYDDTTTNLQTIEQTGLSLLVSKAAGAIRLVVIYSGNTAATNADKVYGAFIAFTQPKITGR